MPFLKLPDSLFPCAIFGLVLAAYLCSGLFHINQFITADEHYWIYERIPRYWQAWEKREFRKTFINDKPGVSLALVAGPALFFTPDTTKHCEETPSKLLRCDPNESARILFAFRLPLLIFNGFILIYLFWLLSRLTNPWLSLFTTLGTALAPSLIGITQIVNPDALIWSTGGAALFSFYALLQFQERKFILATALFGALALLAKYAALVLFPFFGMLILAQFFSSSLPSRENVTRLKKNIEYSIVTFIGTLMLFSLALPALLLRPESILTYFENIPHTVLIIGSIFFVSCLFLFDIYFMRARYLGKIADFSKRYFFLLRYLPLIPLFFLCATLSARWLHSGWDIFSLPFDNKYFVGDLYRSIDPNFLEIIIIQLSPICFSLTPLLLVGLVLLSLFSLRKKTLPYSFFAFTLCIFCFLYLFFITQSNVLVTVRYVVFLYPILAFLAGLGYWHLFEKLKTMLRARDMGQTWKLLLPTILFTVSLTSIVSIFPYYLNYMNFLLPKQSLLTDAWGYGGYEAAQYINSLPDAENITVWADYHGVCEFIIGKCLTAYTFDKNIIQPDYYVLTRRGRIRNAPRTGRLERNSGLTPSRYYDRSDPVWSLNIDDRPGNYVKVFQVEK